MSAFNEAAQNLRWEFARTSAAATPTASEPEFSPEMQAKTRRAYDTLMPEALSLLDEAERLLEEKQTQLAARTFHSAAVFLQTLDSLRPLDDQHRQKLHYAVWRTRLCSHLLENFVHEHFGEADIEDDYDMRRENELGKGSYGAVYLATHKRTGEQFACKVINVTRIGSYYLHKLHTEIVILRER
jgi:hypothetical protein